MKANLYVQGRFWATIELAQDSVLALLAQGMITHATHKALQLHEQLNDLEEVHCCISLAFTEPVPDTPETDTQP